MGLFRYDWRERQVAFPHSSPSGFADKTASALGLEDKSPTLKRECYGIRAYLLYHSEEAVGTCWGEVFL